MNTDKNGQLNQNKKHEGFAQDGLDTSKAKRLLETVQKSSNEQNSQQKNRNKGDSK
ncbi:hypothetical protein PCO85_05520 [Prodigiosinella aquatilis]|nr:hypothetical protein [Prodigiosinella sp. LS101]WJV54887.1 hypothetical protein PCO85_05520 [Prodigiosinella sp. LS101]WJV59250.1 hypothetical protein PCO84_05530 [Pectobacteriaceae bacterium C111]